MPEEYARRREYSVHPPDILGKYQPEDMQVKPMLTGIITGVDTDGDATSEIIGVAPNTTTYSKKRYAKLGTEQATQDEDVL